MHASSSHLLGGYVQLQEVQLNTVSRAGHRIAAHSFSSIALEINISVVRKGTGRSGWMIYSELSVT